MAPFRQRTLQPAGTHLRIAAALTVALGSTACSDEAPRASNGARNQLAATGAGGGAEQGTAEANGSAALAAGFQSLRDRIGPNEKVNLEVYFVGFPAELQASLESAIQRRLGKVSIVDAKPWWIPNKPLYGQPAFSTKLAPPGLPKDIVPPDGLIRYEPLSLEKDLFGKWRPVKDLVDMYNDWHVNADVMYYAEHDGSRRDLPWKVSALNFHHLPATTLDTLYPALEKSRTHLDTEHPAGSFDLYSHADLFDWLERSGTIAPPSGGAAMVFINFDKFAGTDYAFYADPARDIVDITGVAPTEVQYPRNAVTTDAHRGVAEFYTNYLSGGLSQVKMHASLETECAETGKAGQAGLPVPGALPNQTVCTRWRLRPIRNVQGNKGRLFFVSDSTELLAEYNGAQAGQAKLLEGVESDLFELYRYGVLNASVKGNPFSEKYELRTAVLDLRYTARELCAVQHLNLLVPDLLIPALCNEVSGAGEATYQLTDVFDEQLAKTSLAEFAPGEWQVNYVEVPFDPNFVASAKAKRDIRTILDAPIIADHTPLYRNLSVPVGGEHVQITSSWEKGPDFILTQLANTLGPQYEKLWPGPQPVFARPYHETGVPMQIPHLLVLTPPPDGPTGEKWGPAPVDFQLFTAAGIVTDYGGAGFWASVSGNELGGMFRRDYMLILPQYFLGPRKGAGDNPLYWVMPDGDVQISPVPIAWRSIDLGAPHWCNEFNSPNAAKRAACRRFLRNTTTLQSIETIQHGLGYMHSPEPRVRYAYDGELASVKRLQQINENPLDLVGRRLHRKVNQYTTLGVSTVWGQDVSEWNAVGPAAGMQATLFRSHAREMIEAVEKLAQQASDRLGTETSADKAAVQAHIDAAITDHTSAADAYEAWNYRESIAAAQRALVRLDDAFTAMGEPDRIP